MYLPMYFNTLIAVLALVARELLQSWLSLAHAGRSSKFTRNYTGFLHIM